MFTFYQESRFSHSLTFLGIHNLACLRSSELLNTETFSKILLCYFFNYHLNMRSDPWSQAGRTIPTLFPALFFQSSHACEIYLIVLTLAKVTFLWVGKWACIPEITGHLFDFVNILNEKLLKRIFLCLQTVFLIIQALIYFIFHSLNGSSFFPR